MIKLLLIIALFVSSTLLCTAQIPPGRYFYELKGSVWKSPELSSDTAVQALTQIGLRIIEFPIDSLKSNSTLWFFSDSLTIANYDVKTHSTTIILTCGYSLNEEQHILKLFFDNKDVPIRSFQYTSVSTGNFVLLLIDKRKHKK